MVRWEFVGRGEEEKSGELGQTEERYSSKQSKRVGREEEVLQKSRAVDGWVGENRANRKRKKPMEIGRRGLAGEGRPAN